MSVAAPTSPARVPMRGGVEGATVRVHPLLCAEIRAPPGLFDRPRGPLGTLRGLGLHVPRSRWTWLPIPAFLVEHPGAGPVLIDTGFHASAAKHPAQSLGPVAAGILSLRVTPEQAVPAQLERLGVAPEGVRTVLMTHLHFDHTGGIEHFPQATFVVDGKEWRAAQRQGRRGGYLHRLIDHRLDWRLLDFDRPEVEGFATFGRSLDVFGDGSVRLLSTPGHSPGHLSVLVRLDDRELLLTGDAAYARRSIDEDLLPLVVDDVHLYRRSLAELRRYIELTPDAAVICGHDPWSWPELDPVYA